MLDFVEFALSAKVCFPNHTLEWPAFSVNDFCRRRNRDEMRVPEAFESAFSRSIELSYSRKATMWLFYR